MSILNELRTIKEEIKVLPKVYRLALQVQYNRWHSL